MKNELQSNPSVIGSKSLLPILLAWLPGLIASVVSSRHNDPVGNANARLIAAAPELLLAVVACLNAAPSLDYEPAGQIARAAIAKAKGQP